MQKISHFVNSAYPSTVGKIIYCSQFIERFSMWFIGDRLIMHKYHPPGKGKLSQITEIFIWSHERCLFVRPMMIQSQWPRNGNSLKNLKVLASQTLSMENGVQPNSDHEQTATFSYILVERSIDQCEYRLYGSNDERQNLWLSRVARAIAIAKEQLGTEALYNFNPCRYLLMSFKILNLLCHPWWAGILCIRFYRRLRIAMDNNAVRLPAEKNPKLFDSETGL